MTGLVVVLSLSALALTGTKITDRFCEASARTATSADCETTPVAIDPNQAPVFSTAQNLGVIPSAGIVNIPIFATDPEGSSIHFELGDTAPEWLNIDPDTGVVTETNRPEPIRSINFDVHAVDPQGRTGRRTFSLAFQHPRDCHDIYTSGAVLDDSSIAMIDPDQDAIDPFRTICFIENTPGHALEGGWTAVVYQDPNTPAVDWTLPVEKKTPSALLEESYTLSDTQIPTHSHVAFGEIPLVDGEADVENMAIFDAIPLAYGTGNLFHGPRLTESGTVDTGNIPGILNPGNGYDVHRNTGAAYINNDPDSSAEAEGPAITAPQLANTLTFDLRAPLSSGEFTWAFSPNASSAADRGAAYSGDRNSGTRSWIVLVR